MDKIAPGWFNHCHRDRRGSSPNCRRGSRLARIGVATPSASRCSPVMLYLFPKAKNSSCCECRRMCVSCLAALQLINVSLLNTNTCAWCSPGQYNAPCKGADRARCTSCQRHDYRPRARGSTFFVWKFVVTFGVGRQRSHCPSENFVADSLEGRQWRQFCPQK